MSSHPNFAAKRHVQPPASKFRPPPRSNKLPKAIATAGLILSVATTAGIVIYEMTGGHAPSRAAETSTALPLSPSHFTPVTVTGSGSADSVGLTKLISLKLPKDLRPEASATEPVFSVYLKDSDIQVERPYTPLKGMDEDGEMLFWVKKYDHGEVGRWFQRRTVGETVEIRGPVKTLDWREGQWDEVVLISGGTGITPFYQLLHKTFSGTRGDSSSSRTHFTLMHASSSLETLPPPLILDDLRQWAVEHPDRLTLKLYVDKRDTTAAKDVAQARIDASSIEDVRRERGMVRTPSWLDWVRGTQETVNGGKKVLFVVCGPEPMITALSGSRLGRPVGDSPVGGVLGAMGYTSQEVRKL